MLSISNFPTFKISATLIKQSFIHRITSVFFNNFFRFRNTRHRYFVHANLALSLGMAETLFLFGITKTANKVKIQEECVV